jgi:chitin disaccharide deacetylase
MHRIILHADDFGMNGAVTNGILRGFTEGLLTSTSVLANAPDAARALEKWKSLDQQHSAGALPSTKRRKRLDDPAEPFDLGIHLNLTQGRPLTGSRYPAELLDEQGCFPDILVLFRRLRQGEFRQPLEEELARQIEFVLDHGIIPTHLNGHQYVETLPGVAETLPGLMAKYGIGAVRAAVEPGLLGLKLLAGWGLRRFLLAVVQQVYARRFRRKIRRLGLTYPDVYFGTTMAGRIDVLRVQAFLGRMGQSRTGEIGVHPASPAPPATETDLANGWHDPLARFRPNELEMVLSPGLCDLLEQAGAGLGRLAECRLAP